MQFQTSSLLKNRQNHRRFGVEVGFCQAIDVGTAIAAPIGGLKA